jgi:exodeoxyribonuclease VII small subunit
MVKGRSDSKGVEVRQITLEELMRGGVSIEELSGLKYEDALMLLEGVVAAVEGGNLPLDQAIGSFEHGTQLVRHLRGLLAGVEEKLRELGGE